MTRHDYERAFGAAALSTRFGPFFSMAASAIRRSAWERLPFDGHLRYSEDVDWTYRIHALGHRVLYVPEARFEHSHDYDVRGQYKRRAGEGTADSAIFRLGPASFTRNLLRPLAGQLVRDVRGGVTSRRGIMTRVAQAVGYYAGRRRARSA